MSAKKEDKDAATPPGLEFQLRGTIGKGQYGVVYQNAAGQAVKIQPVASSEGISVATLMEADILLQCHHPNIIKAFDAVVGGHQLVKGPKLLLPPHTQQPPRYNVALVMEQADTCLARWFDQHILAHHLKAATPKTVHIAPLTEETKLACFRLFHDILEGLAHLNRHGIIHGDLKFQNVLLCLRRPPTVAVAGAAATTSTPPTTTTTTTTTTTASPSMHVAKIGDFGLAQRAHHCLNHQQRRRPLIQSIWYRAPEVILGDQHYGPIVDMWSFAVMLMQAVTNKMPSREMIEPFKLLSEQVQRLGNVPQEPWWRYLVRERIQQVRREMEREAHFAGQGTIPTKRTMAAARRRTGSSGSCPLNYTAMLRHLIMCLPASSSSSPSSSSSSFSSTEQPDKSDGRHQKTTSHAGGASGGGGGGGGGDTVPTTDASSVSPLTAWLFREHFQSYLRAMDLFGSDYALLALDLVEKCLVFDPSRRLTPEQALLHPLFVKCGFTTTTTTTATTNTSTTDKTPAATTGAATTTSAKAAQPITMRSSTTTTTTTTSCSSSYDLVREWLRNKCQFLLHWHSHTADDAIALFDRILRHPSYEGILGMARQGEAKTFCRTDDGGDDDDGDDDDENSIVIHEGGNDGQDMRPGYRFLCTALLIIAGKLNEAELTIQGVPIEGYCIARVVAALYGCSPAAAVDCVSDLELTICNELGFRLTTNNDPRTTK